MPTGNRQKEIVGIALIALLLPFSGCNSRPETPRTDQRVQSAEQTNSHLRVRAPAVAGLFYPAEEPALSQMVDGLLESAPAHHIPHLKGLVCPHAGYPYSGPTAAIAYKTLVGRDVQTVIILGPSHYAVFQGASVPNVDAYQTPLGTVLISEKAQQLAKTSPFVLEPRCLVQRPPVVAAVLQACAGCRRGHARHLGTFRRGSGAVFAEDVEATSKSCPLFLARLTPNRPPRFWPG